jgi:predicted nucleic acid-binding protein
VGALIDTSVLIAVERGELNLSGPVAALGDEPVGMAAITASELLHGVHRLKGLERARAERFVEGLLDRMPVVAFDLPEARVHATLSAELAERGTAVGPHDLIIAATAVSLGYDVATRDLRSFPRIRGLQILRW